MTARPRNDRQLVGVVLHADVTGGTGRGLHRDPSRRSGDARGSSQNNLAAEFLGDYVYAAATRTYGAAVWNDVRNAADCPAIDAFRQELHDEATATGVRQADPEEPRGAEEFEKDHGMLAEPTNPATPPDVAVACSGTFGNSDIYGGVWLDPTP